MSVRRERSSPLSRRCRPSKISQASLASEAPRRRRKALAALCGLTAPVTFVVGLWGTGEYGSSWYGVVGLVLAIALLWMSNKVGRWLP